MKGGLVLCSVEGRGEEGEPGHGGEEGRNGRAPLWKGGRLVMGSRAKDADRDVLRY